MLSAADKRTRKQQQDRSKHKEAVMPGTSFKRGTTKPQTNSQFDGEFVAPIHVLKEGQGFEWIKNKLSKVKTDGQQKGPAVYNNTVLRFLPSFTDGVEDLALDPTASGTYPEENCGNWMYQAEIFENCGNKSATILGGLWGVSPTGKPGWLTESGDTVSCPASKRDHKTGEWSNADHTIAQVIIDRINWRMRYEEMFTKAGVPTDLPERWEKWRHPEYGITKARCSFSGNSYTLIQAFVLVEDGDNKEVMGKGVFAVTKSAVDDFLRNVTTQYNRSEPLSLANNELGDFLSCAGGHTVSLEIKPPAKQGGDQRAEYFLRLNREQPMPIDAANTALHWMPWESVLADATVEKVVELCIEAYGEEAVDYALRGHEVYGAFAPERILGKAAGISDMEKGKWSDIRNALEQGVHSRQLAANAPQQAQTQQPPAAPAAQVTPVTAAAAPPPAFKAASAPNAAANAGVAAPQPPPTAPAPAAVTLAPVTQNTDIPKPPTPPTAPGGAAPAPLANAGAATNTTPAPVAPAPPAPVPSASASAMTSPSEDNPLSAEEQENWKDVMSRRG